MWEACASLSPYYFIFPMEFTGSVWTNKLEQLVAEEGRIHKIMPESVFPGFILFETVSSTLAIWFPLVQAQAAFLVTGSLNSCMNFMDCLHALSFSKVPLSHIVLGFFLQYWHGRSLFHWPWCLEVTPESWIGWKIQMQNLSQLLCLCLFSH